MARPSQEDFVIFEPPSPKQDPQESFKLFILIFKTSGCLLLGSFTFSLDGLKGKFKQFLSFFSPNVFVKTRIQCYKYSDNDLFTMLTHHTGTAALLSVI